MEAGHKGAFGGSGVDPGMFYVKHKSFRESHFAQKFEAIVNDDNYSHLQAVIQKIRLEQAS